MYQRSWARITGPYHELTYLHIYLLQELKYLFEKMKIKKKEAKKQMLGVFEQAYKQKSKNTIENFANFGGQ